MTYKRKNTRAADETKAQALQAEVAKLEAEQAAVKAEAEAQQALDALSKPTRHAAHAHRKKGRTAQVAYKIDPDLRERWYAESDKRGLTRVDFLIEALETHIEKAD